MKAKILEQHNETLKRIVAQLDADDSLEIDADRVTVVQNVKSALAHLGHEVSESQAESFWSDFSYNKYAGWVVGGDTIEAVFDAIFEFCDDVENGENHIGI